MRALLLMFVMLTSSITIAQDGLYLVFDCDRPLRIERQTKAEALSVGDVFVTIAVTSDPKTTTTSIFDLGVVGLFIYNDSTEGHIEDWDETVYDDYFQDLSNRVAAQIKRNERLVIIEAAFVTYSTESVTLSLIKDVNNDDAVLFDGGAYSFDLKFSALLEELSSSWEYTYIELQFPLYVGIVQDELDRIAAKLAFIGTDEMISATVSASVTQQDKKDIFDALEGKVTSSGKSIYLVSHNQETIDGLTYHVVEVYTGEVGNVDSIYVDETALVSGSLENMEDSDLIEFYKRVASAAYDL